MNLEFREVTDANHDDWRHVVSWVYKQQAPETSFGTLEPGELRYVTYADGKPASACSVYEYQIARSSSVLRAAGVAAVATLPEYRRSGSANLLMSKLLDDLSSKGFAISALYGFRESYYRRFGYETCGWRYQISCPQSRLPDLKIELPVRQIASGELEQLADTYLQFIRSRSGSPLRTAQDWIHRMGVKHPMVYAVGDPIEAYLWANLDGFWGEVRIGEMAWTSKKGYEGCLSLIRSLCSNQSTVTWSEPPDSPFIATHLDQGHEISISRATMFRMIDLKTAFTNLKSNAHAPYSFRSTDAQLSANQGVWRIQPGLEGSKVDLTDEIDFEIDVTNLIQAFLGQPSLRELEKHGLVRVHKRDGFEAACEHLTALPVVCMEFF